MPITLPDKVKSIFWALMEPFWPPLRYVVRLLGIRPYGKHQPYLVGTLRSDKTPAEFRKYLVGAGFATDPLAWVDDDEIFGLRQLESFRYQSHLRLYSNGEVHVHHELTPEYDNWGHRHDKDTRAPNQEFMKLLEDWIVPQSN